MAKVRRRIKNAILKTITAIAGLVFILSACALDSDSWLPFIALCISALWLSVFAYANGWLEGRWDDDL